MASDNAPDDDPRSRPTWLWIGPLALVAALLVTVLRPEDRPSRTPTPATPAHKDPAQGSTQPDAGVVAQPASASLRGRLKLPPVEGNGPSPALSEAQVWILETESWPPVDAHVSADGQFVLTELPPGSYRLDAKLGPARAAPAVTVNLAPGDEREIEVTLAQGKSLGGRVTDALSNRPMPGATVTAVENSPALRSFSSTTDAQGRFHLEGLLNAEHTVSVRADGYVPSPEQLVSIGRQDLELTLEAGVKLVGRVVDERGMPVAGARLEVRGETRAGIPFAIAGSGAWTPIPLFPGDDAPFDPALANLGNLGVTRGVVPPLPLHPTHNLAKLGAEESEQGALTTDQAGQFSLVDLPAGHLRLLARHPAYAPAHSQALRLQPGASANAIEIVLPTPGRVEGQVLDRQGQPLPGVQIALESESFVIPMTSITDEQGSFHFGPVAGACVLRAEPADGWPTTADVLVPPGETIVHNIQLLGGEEVLDGRVEDDRGQPLDNANLELRSRRSTPVALVAHSDPAGAFHFQGLLAGTYELVAQREGYATSAPHLVQIPAGRPPVINLLPGLLLTGEIRDAWTGTAVPKAHVRLDKTPHRAISNNEGSFEIRNVSDGNYSIIVTSTEHAVHRQSIQLMAQPFERPTHIDILLHRAATLSGTVVDRYGAMASGVRVSARASSGQPAQHVEERTDEAGNFALRGLAAGEYRLEASHDLGGRAEFDQPITVQDGEERTELLLRLPEAVPQGSEEPSDPNATETQASTAETQTDSDSNHDSTGSRLFSLPPVTLEGSNAGVIVVSSANPGIRQGDHVVSINGESVMSAGQARSMLRGPRGSLVRVTLRRGGHTVSVKVTRP